MSNLKDAQQFTSKSTVSINTDVQVSTLLKSSGYHSASDSENNSTRENEPKKESKGKVGPKFKFVSSRYRQAVTSTVSRMRNNSGNLQQSTSQKDVSRLMSDLKYNSPGRLSSKTGINASCMKISNSSKFTSYNGSRARKEDNNGKLPPGLQSPNMHSTAVNATLLDSTRGIEKAFSSTLIFAPSKRRAHHDMPDISAIQPFLAGKNERTTAKNCLPKEEVSFDSDDEPSDILQADLDLEYLRYLMWVYINCSSGEAFRYHCSDAEKQITFLMHIIKEKQEKIVKHKKHIMVKKLHKQVTEQHNMLMEALGSFAEIAPVCQKSVEEIGQHLHSKVHQVKLKNIYIPQDKREYEDQFKIALLENNKIMKTIETDLNQRREDSQFINEAVKILNNKLHSVSICKKTANEVASCAIQESSLNLTVNDSRN